VVGQRRVTAGLAAAQGFGHASGSDTDTAKIVEPINTEISAPGDIPLLEDPARGEVRKGNMIYRPLGTTGEMVSLIGMGGFHLGKTSTEEEAIRLIHAAVDNAWTTAGTITWVRVNCARGRPTRKAATATKFSR
jgi:hypothetical protein